MRLIKKILLTLIILGFSLSQNAFAQDHKLFTEILDDYVRDVSVNYAGLCEDKRLDVYVDQLSNTDPDQLSTSNEKIAFWINVYNAFTLKVICDNYPIDSINDLNPGGLLLSVALKRTVWDRKLVTINGEETTLKAVEHDILWPRFKEPRAHFAIACGAISCAPLSAEAYEGDKLDQQLEKQARRYFNDKRFNSFDLKKKRAYLSNILNWNEQYFGEDKHNVLVYISQYLPKNVADQIKSDPKQWKIKYNKYKLDLNDKK